jgi:stage III sporulation protein AE
MKRKILLLVSLAATAFFLFPTVSFASGEIDGIWKDYLEILPGASGEEQIDDALSSVGFDALLGELLGAAEESFSPAASFFAFVMGLAALMALGEHTLPSERIDKRGAGAVGSVIASAALLSQMRGAVSAVSASLSELTVFFSGLVPILTGVLAAGGSSEGAAMQAMNMNLTLGIISFVQSELLMPLVASLFCISAVSGIDSGGVSKIAKAIKSFFLFVCGLVTTVLASALAMQSLISNAKDSAYLRAARYAASGMIPMVGGSVSSALAVLGGGLSVLRGAIGAGAIVAIAGMTLSPLIMLLLYKLSLNIAVFVLEAAGASSGGVRSFSALKGALDALIAVYSMTVLISVLEVIVFLKSGVDVFG